MALSHGAGLKYLVIMGIFAFAFPALAGGAAISGKVRDSGGGVFENLPVFITSVATHKKLEVRTTKAGVFGPVSLPEGVYRVEIRADCFKRYSKVVTLSGPEPIQLDIALVETCHEPTVVE